CAIITSGVELMDMDANKQARSTSGTETKKTYSKPLIRYERIFETQALVCGKLHATQAQCVNNRKLS
ncbi:MAG: hypothetical protein M3P45_11890, partial [Acidobacteriota bacterium]|nr:hypothetical protein [Acidobacteriota bacterium]